MKIIANENGCAESGIFNIGNPTNDLSVKELAEKLIALVKEYPAYRDKAEACRIVEVTSDSYYGKGYQDMLTRVPSVKNAEKRLGWKPVTGIDDALRKTLDFYLVEEREKIEHLL
jgi:nucleoside-diphosphate-sugar epimerase